MLKVMIVDDEPTIIKGLSCLIDWEEFGFCVSMTARSAEKALEMIEEERPNLIVTDVHMPKMNGIEFIEQARKKYPEINIIIISGYDEFEYAKKAIDFQIDGYLLKPVDEDELITILKRVRRRYTERRAYINQMLYSLIHSVKGLRDGMPDWSTEPELSQNNGFRYVKVDFSKKDDINSTKLRKCDDTLYSDILHEWLGEKYSYLAVGESNKCIGIVMPMSLCTENGGIDKFAEKIIGLYDGIVKVRILFGQEVKTLPEISTSYASIKQLENVAFYNPEANSLLYDECEEYVFSASGADDEFTDEFINRINDGQNSDKCVDDLIKNIRSNNVSPEIFVSYINSVAIKLIKNVIDIGGDALPITAKHSVFHHAQNVDIAVCEMFMKDICRCYIQNIFDVCNSRGYIGEICEYIKNNYHEDITLSYFAKKFYLNSSYLGSIFKKKMGVSFSEYLRNRRIEEAKKLLRSSDLKVFEIAMRVGFNDAGYFSKRFEDAVGMTPNEYRRKVMDGGNDF